MTMNDLVWVFFYINKDTGKLLNLGSTIPSDQRTIDSADVIRVGLDVCNKFVSGSLNDIKPNDYRPATQSEYAQALIDHNSHFQSNVDVVVVNELNNTIKNRLFNLWK